MLIAPEYHRTAPPPSRSRTRARVLWVDDDPNLTASYARQLRREGIEVVPASDGMQGYWLAVTMRPDLIITDLRMPRWEGDELIDCLATNKETAGIPRIVLSGYVNEEVRRRMMHRGVEAVLDKPVPFGTLRGALRRAGLA